MTAAPDTVTPAWLAARIAGNRAEDVRRSIAALITGGELPPGTRLPTIRALAEALGTTPSAVTEAWGALRDEGLLVTRRRGGTQVVGPGAQPRERVTDSDRTLLDLLHGTPDVRLLPDIGPALTRSITPIRTDTIASTITAPLLTVLAGRWPFPAGDFTALPSGSAALRQAAAAAIELAGTNADGSPPAIAVQDPTLLRSVKVLRALGVPLIPVEVDAEGPTPESLRAALDRGARVLVHQPSWSIPLGSTLSSARRDELASLLDRGDDTPWIVEDEPAGPLHGGSSLGERLPERTVQIAQYWRTFGHDIEVAPVGGAAPLVAAITASQRRHGIRASRLLQDTLAVLLSDAAVTAQVDAAAGRYRARHRALAGALARHGVHDASFGGLFLWIPVEYESDVVGNLAVIGIGAVAGSRSFVAPGRGSFIRIAATRVPEDPAGLDQLAAAIALAVQGGIVSEGE